MISGVRHSIHVRGFIPNNGLCCLHRKASTAKLREAKSSEFNKTIEDGIAHVTTLNVKTNDRSIVELSLQKGKESTKIKREFVLPDAAIAGLRNSLLNLSRSPKQLQNEADQLAEKLSQRKFPASPAVVKDARNKIKEKLRKSQKDEIFLDDEMIGDKIREAREYQLRNQVDKLLKKSHYNWKPIEINSKEEAATYALARLVPNFAEIARSLEEFNRTNFVPQTVLDYGSGSGASFWAIHDKFGDGVKEYCMVDTSDAMTQFSMDIMRGEDDSSTHPLVHRRVNFRRHLIPSLQTTYDLVIAHRSLSEFGSHETRLQVLTDLWRRTNKYLLLIESSKEDSFTALMEARDYLLYSGFELHLEETAKMLEEKNLLNDHLSSILKDKRLSEYERFTMIREAVPQNITLPTALPTSTVFAPCPHDLGCPLLNSKTACTFPVRYRGLRADGKRTSKENDGTQTSAFSFVIMEKANRQPTGEHLSRILKITKHNGHVTCDLCTAYKGLQRMTVSKRTGELYQRVKSRRNGELFPLSMATKATESLFDVYETIEK